MIGCIPPQFRPRRIVRHFGFAKARAGGPSHAAAGHPLPHGPVAHPPRPRVHHPAPVHRPPAAAADGCQVTALTRRLNPALGAGAAVPPGVAAPGLLPHGWPAAATLVGGLALGGVAVGGAALGGAALGGAGLAPAPSPGGMAPTGTLPGFGGPADQPLHLAAMPVTTGGGAGGNPPVPDPGVPMPGVVANVVPSPPPVAVAEPASALVLSAALLVLALCRYTSHRHLAPAECGARKRRH